MNHVTSDTSNTRCDKCQEGPSNPTMPFPIYSGDCYTFLFRGVCFMRFIVKEPGRRV